MKFSIRHSLNLAAFALVIMLAAVTGAAQPATNPTQKTEPSSFAGKYEGTVKDDADGEARLTFDIVEAAGKFSGTLTTPRGVFKIIKGQVADGVLTLEIERPSSGTGTMTLRQSGNGLTASFSEAGKNLTVELHNVVADEISGEWDAVADASGQAFPFTLTLKLEGEKVTGNSSSQLGSSNISSGSWKDGKLMVILEGGTGQIGLVATMVEGKLSGDYDYAGQLQGKFVAIRKK